MSSLLIQIRRIVLGFSLVVAIGAFIYFQLAVPEPSERLVKLTDFYALTALAFLYFALLATPLTQAVPMPRLRVVYVKARRAIGVSAFFFGLIHAAISFFFLIGGFSGLLVLPLRGFVAVTFGFSALLILSLLAATSFDVMVRALGPKWKILHRLVYLAAVLIMIHGILIGLRLGNIENWAAKTFYAAVVFLFSLEMLRVYRFLRAAWPALPPRVLAGAMVILTLAASVSLYVFMNIASAGVR